MNVSIVANVINVAGNCVGVFILHLGAAGVAWPSLLSRMLSAAAVTVYCFRKQNPVRYRRADIWAWDGGLLKKVMGIAQPNGVENGVHQMVKVALSSMVALFGTYQIAATPLIVCYSAISPEAKELVIWLVLINNIFNGLAYPFAGSLGNGLRAVGDVKFTMVVSISLTIGARHGGGGMGIGLLGVLAAKDLDAGSTEQDAGGENARLSGKKSVKKWGGAALYADKND